MASKVDKEKPRHEDAPVEGQRLSESMGLADALAQKNPALAARLARKNAIKLSPEQEELLAVLFDTDEQFGERGRNRIQHIRLGDSLETRMNEFLRRFKRVEKTRLMEIALHRLLQEFGI